MGDDPQTWHRGLVADWWAEFNDDFRAHEIDYYRSWVEAGGPILDAGCGHGRLLVPFLDAGLDVDGCDVSADMIDRCRSKAAAAGHAPTLRVQPLHELDMPRRYRTIMIVGTFGIGSNRQRDQEALRRLRNHLEPGGTLLIDIGLPYWETDAWARWSPGGRDDLPQPMPDVSRRRRARDGSEYGMTGRMLALDPLDQTVTTEIRIERWRGDELEAAEQHVMHHTMYLRHEVELMLRLAGFADVEVHGEHQRRAATADDVFVVFVARG